jgi:hypothetical protein
MLKVNHGISCNMGTCCPGSCWQTCMSQRCSVILTCAYREILLLDLYFFSTYNYHIPNISLCYFSACPILHMPLFWPCFYFDMHHSSAFAGFELVSLRDNLHLCLSTHKKVHLAQLVPIYQWFGPTCTQFDFLYTIPPIYTRQYTCIHLNVDDDRQRCRQPRMGWMCREHVRASSDAQSGLAWLGLRFPS